MRSVEGKTRDERVLKLDNSDGEGGGIRVGKVGEAEVKEKRCEGETLRGDEGGHVGSGRDVRSDEL